MNDEIKIIFLNNKVNTSKYKNFSTNQKYVFGKWQKNILYISKITPQFILIVSYSNDLKPILYLYQIGLHDFQILILIQMFRNYSLKEFIKMPTIVFGSCVETIKSSYMSVNVTRRYKNVLRRDLKQNFYHYLC